MAAPVAAQSDLNPGDYDRALAAGYKAQFICSGLWNGGKSLADIKADELTGIYDHIAKIVPTLKADIDEDKRQVRVTYSDEMPPRTAIWNSETGCTGLPIGFTAGQSGAPFNLREFHDDLPWPMGDRGAETAPGETFKPLLQDALGTSGRSKYGGKTSGVLVIKDGRIVGEHYKQGHDLHTAQRTWSVAKSIAGTLIGHSVQQGLSDVNAPANISAWTHKGDPRRQITLDNLMRMASGLTSDTAGNRTDPVYMGGASVSQRTTSWPLLHKPGTQFRYANNDTLLAVHAVHDSAFDPYGFFRKLGMTRTYAETDWQGNYILSSQVWTTARDLGRLGMLYLNDGIWPYGGDQAQRLLPAKWREYVSSPSGPQPDREFGYGATFWLMNKTDGVPQDSFAAFGNRGQYLVIIPSLDLVIVRRGYDTPGNSFDIAAFTRDVVSAEGS
ncbi:serine hydrolase [Parasphingorhabdus sp.]|uniref:serine hydrolase domain-containing protein n=1 Tax=Parasphingorhabdus sp. TaxID=2709688 RepID=UPI002F950313